MKVLRRIIVKAFLPILMLAALLMSPVAAGAFGLEIAVGGWYQMPEGDIAYDPFLGSDTLDVEDDLDYGDKFQFSGRINLDLPFYLPIPTVYLGSRIRPTDWLALEFEGRGIALSGDSYLGLIGRLKVTFFDPFFAAAGYRYETIDFDEQGVEVDATIAGPFAEIGFAF